MGKLSGFWLRMTADRQSLAHPWMRCMRAVFTTLSKGHDQGDAKVDPSPIPLAFALFPSSGAWFARCRAARPFSLTWCQDALGCSTSKVIRGIYICVLNWLPHSSRRLDLQVAWAQRRTQSVRFLVRLRAQRLRISRVTTSRLARLSAALQALSATMQVSAAKAAPYHYCNGRAGGSPSAAIFVWGGTNV